MLEHWYVQAGMTEWQLTGFWFTVPKITVSSDSTSDVWLSISSSTSPTSSVYKQGCRLAGMLIALGDQDYSLRG